MEEYIFGIVHSIRSFIFGVRAFPQYTDLTLAWQGGNLTFNRRELSSCNLLYNTNCHDVLPANGSYDQGSDPAVVLGAEN